MADSLDPISQFKDDLIVALAQESAISAQDLRSSLSVPPRDDLGDVAIACHRFAKSMGVNPNELASRFSEAAMRAECVAEAKAQGPFVNIFWDRGRLASDTIGAVRQSFNSDLPGGFVAGAEGRGRRIVIDFSSPNAARKLAFHHLRGTAIGAALARLYEARGFKVVRLNHLGDYGHNMALLLYKLSELDPDSSSTDQLPALSPQKLQELYVEANLEEQAEPERVKSAARGWLKRLSSNDRIAQQRWQMIVTSTTEALDKTYSRLDIHFDEYRGESRYFDEAIGVARSLVATGTASVDPENGSIFVPPEDGFQPIVLVNSQGISTYEGRDIAAAIERYHDFTFDRCVYLTDVGQGGRFRSFFAAMQRAGYAWAAGLSHVGFGQMRLGGRKAKTRGGDAVALDDVLDEAHQRAMDEVEGRLKSADAKVAGETSSEGVSTEGQELAQTAEQIGIGAVLFSQVRMRRTADFDFDLDEAVSFKGETAPRVQYTFARICSILAKAGVDIEAALTVDGGTDIGGEGSPVRSLLDDPLEHRVVKAIALLPTAARQALASDDPSFLADGVLAITDAWASYQTAGARERTDLRVLAEDPALRQARLELAAATAIAVRDGLAILGVECPEYM